MTKSKSFNKYILEDLKTDEDIKEWINIGFQEFLQDNDLNAFVKALEVIGLDLGVSVVFSVPLFVSDVHPVKEKHRDCHRSR